MTAIQKHMLMMFISLRWGVGVVGLSLPIILAGVGYLHYGIPLAGSMSAYYHATKGCSGEVAAEAQEAASATPLAPIKSGSIAGACEAIGEGPMRNWFVGNLFFFGGAMLLMRGFSRFENWALNIAGIMAPCVALFPMNWGTETGRNPHLIFAIIFFVCIGFTCVFCSGKTLKEMPQSIPNRALVIAFYRRWYRIFGILMVAAPIGAHLFIPAADTHRMFFVEAAGIWAFGLYWLLKTSELKRSDVEKKAMMGQLAMNPRTLG